MRRTAAGLTRTEGKSSTTILSITVENVPENSRCFGWPRKAVKSSLLLKVIKKAWVKPWVSISWLSMSCPLFTKVLSSLRWNGYVLKACLEVALVLVGNPVIQKECYKETEV